MTNAEKIRTLKDDSEMAEYLAKIFYPDLLINLNEKKFERALLGRLKYQILSKFLETRG